MMYNTSIVKSWKNRPKVSRNVANYVLPMLANVNKRSQTVREKIETVYETLWNFRSSAEVRK